MMIQIMLNMSCVMYLWVLEITKNSLILIISMLGVLIIHFLELDCMVNVHGSPRDAFMKSKDIPLDLSVTDGNVLISF